MEKIGIICEYNPFHNGHIHHLKKVKKMYPDSLIVLILNGYFLQRGEISILSKYDKTKIALENDIDLVIELPLLYGTQSADTFAYYSVYYLNLLKVDKIIFGSETNDINKLYDMAKVMNEENFSSLLKNNLDSGINYPSALAKSVANNFTFLSNDLLGISYIKATLKINPNIKCECIKRTSSYLDTTSNKKVISALNIREKLTIGENVEKYMPKKYIKKITMPNNDLLYKLLKTIILQNNNLNEILDVDEGIENRLYKGASKYNNLSDFVSYIKTKRYTYNKINRMLIHILFGIKKKDAKIKPSYIKILGINKNGKKYLNKIKKDLPLKIDKSSYIYSLELKSSMIYDLLQNQNTFEEEKKNKPIFL